MSDGLCLETFYATHPADHEHTVVEPKLLLVLTNPAANDKEGERNSTKRPCGDAHQRTMCLIWVAVPVVELGGHLGCVRGSP